MTYLRPTSRRVGLEAQALAADRQMELERVPILNGTLLEDVTPNADGAVTIVPHKLGRTWRGWFVTRQKYSGNESYTTAAGTPSNVYTSLVSHGLGAAPMSFQVSLVNLTAEMGYTAGDGVYFQWTDDNVANGGVSIEVPDSSQFRVSVLNGGVVLANATTLVPAVITTPANWAIYTTAYRPRSLAEVTNKTSGADPSKYLYLKGLGFTGTDKVDLWVF